MRPAARLQRVLPSDGLFGTAERIGFPAAHDCEDAILGAGLATGHGRVDEVETAFLGGGVKLTRTSLPIGLREEL